MVGHIPLKDVIGVRVPDRQHQSTQYRETRERQKPSNRSNCWIDLFSHSIPGESGIQNKKLPIKAVFC